MRRQECCQRSVLAVASLLEMATPKPALANTPKFVPFAFCRGAGLISLVLQSEVSRPGWQ